MKTNLLLDGISVHAVDVVIIACYLLTIVVGGLLLSRLASHSLDNYFLGGRRLPWWLLGLSGTACYFDVAGVMWTVAMFYVMGQQFVWPQFMWGYVIMLACFATFMGKWLRRTGVMTGAEWMVVRFGDGPAGRFARDAYAVMAVVIAMAFVGFAEFGSGLFMQPFLPSPDAIASTWLESRWQHVLAVGLMGLTTLYTVSAGLVGVGFTGFVQFVIVLVGSSVLIVKAVAISDHDTIAAAVPAEWLQIRPPLTWDRLDRWELSSGWVLFLPAVITWLVKGCALGAGGPQQLYDLQRFLAARSPREASLAGMIWGIGLVPMFMVSAAVGVIGIVEWGGDIANPTELYPLVIGTMLPIGLKGLVLAGLLSAFMSTFSATVNAGASYLTFDLYARYVAPNASQPHLVRASRISSLVIVGGGIAIGMTARNINAIFDWIMMVLGTGVLVPNVLRWFWWRFNGIGFAVGTLCGVAAGVLVPWLLPHASSHATFLILLAISLSSSVAAACLTSPTDPEVLEVFYNRVRPAGWWRPFRQRCQLEPQPHDSFGWDLVSTVLTVAGLQALYLMSTYAVTHQWTAFAGAACVAAFSATALYFTWYQKLPAPSEA